MSLDRRAMLKASALGVGGLAVATALPADVLPAAHAGPPPTPKFGPDIDPYARYEGQTQCIGTEQPGVAAFKQLLLSHYPGSRNLGILRACGVGGTSEHKEGRAFDWGVYASRPNEAAWAQEVLNWLLGTDQYGNRQALARRFGIMYIIWNRRIWKAYNNPNTWQTYTGSNPHTDHIHFSFGWPGARKETSWWRGSASPQTPHQWSAWTPTANGLASAPAAASWDAKRTDLFAISSAGTLVQRWMVSGGGWGPGSSWHDLGAPPGRRLVHSPVVVSRGPGMLDVFAVANDGAVWQKAYNTSTSWQPWYSLGGKATSAPAAASMDSGHVTVVVRGTSNKLHSRTWRRGQGWTGWSTLAPEAVTSAPALVSHSPGHLDLFVRGSARDCVHKSYVNGRWSGWTSRGGVIADGTTISATSMSPGRFDLFVIGTNNRVYRQVYLKGGWYFANKAWENFGGPANGAVSGVGTTSLHSTHLEVFTRSADGRLYQRWYS